MPITTGHAYNPPGWSINGHFDTIFPALFRKVIPVVTPDSHTINTPDQDYFDLDFYDANSDKTVIISHGLEGNSNRPYVLGMVNAFLRNGWNAIAWNYRGCNGSPNNTTKSYHSGFTEDLKEVIHFAGNHNKISVIALVGFSLGGNMTLKYLAEKQVDSVIVAGVGISVPLDLYGSCIQISKTSNTIYKQRFLKSLKRKVVEKSRLFPEIDSEKLAQIKDLKAFDDFYTAPLHGFKDALDYYESCSAIKVLDQINTPTLVLNAKNDPFLPDSCYPGVKYKENSNVYFEFPERGGHVGFYSKNREGIYFSEKRAVEFVNTVLSD